MTGYVGGISDALKASDQPYKAAIFQSHLSYLIYESNTSFIMSRSDLSFSDKQRPLMSSSTMKKRKNKFYTQKKIVDKTKQGRPSILQCHYQLLC